MRIVARISGMARGLADRFGGDRTLQSEVRIHQAGRPRRGSPLMTGVIALSGLLGAATFALTVAATPTPPGMDGGPEPTRTIADLALLPGTDPNASALLSGQWDRAALGSDSAAHASLLSEPYNVTVEIESGDTLMSVLLSQGSDRREAHAAIQALSDVFDPRDLRPGQTLDMAILPARASDAAIIEYLRFRPDPLRDILVELSEDGFVAREETRSLSDHQVRAEGTISSSLYVAARDAGVPIPVLGDLINVFSFDVDFQREVQPGDRFAVMFTERLTSDGNVADFGDIQMAEMTVGGAIKRFYRFENDEGRVDYFDERGQSVRRALLRTPVEGARISSGFGQRRHPISGYTRMHRGTDFAAPSGTPIYAAGDGVVEAAGWNGGYGRYIRIRHNGRYSTAYAHLSRIDSRVSAGARVSQRQIIGYVGSSGRSTGPHLHYEVLVDGDQVNPLSIDLPTGETLEGAQLARFQRIRSEIDQEYASLEPRTQVAAQTDTDLDD